MPSSSKVPKFGFEADDVVMVSDKGRTAFGMDNVTKSVVKRTRARRNNAVGHATSVGCDATAPSYPMRVASRRNSGESTFAGAIA